MVKPQRLIPALLVFVCCGLGLRAQFIWSGLGTSGDISLGANWHGQVAPPNNGTADLYLGKAVHETLFLPGNYSLNSIIVGTTNNQYYIDAAPGTTLSVASGVSFADDNGERLWFTSNVNLVLSGAQVLNARAGNITVSGQITGTGPLTLVSTSAAQSGAFIFNNTGAGNTYTGGTTMGDGVNSVVVAFWNSSPFGSGAVNLLTGVGTIAQLIAHGTQTIANPFTVAGLGAVNFRSWDAPVTYSGAITLASNTIFQANTAQNALPAPNQAGSFPIPGPFSRNPIVFSGNIGESGGARSMTFGGVGVSVLTGTNTYTGGTTINGSVVFGSAASVPASGAILVNNGGYVGFGDNTASALANFIAGHQITAGSGGGIGVDTLPGNSIATFNDAIDLSTFYSASTNLRIGSATSAILTGTITPQSLATGYRFGNGGGTLYVQSTLSAATFVQLINGNSTVPLTLYLQGNNSYTGPTTVSNGFLVFDGASSIPAATTLAASGSSTSVGASYLGYTDITLGSSSAFLSKFLTPANTWGIIGFDTHQGNSTTTINGIDLTGFNDGVFIGTMTSANITGTLSPTTVTNGNNAARTLRFTAAQNGVLNVNSIIADGAFPISVMLGTPAVTGPYSSGTVVMNGSNTYTGGTTLNAFNIAGLTLGIGNNSALGTGTLLITTDPTGGGANVGIKATTGGINLANAINLFNAGGVGFAGPRLSLTGTNAFTLSGNITGDNTTEIDLFNAAPLTVTLSGDNSGFLGSIGVYNGILNLLHNSAAGLGTLNFGDNGTGIVAYGGGAIAPTLYGIFGSSGSLVIPTGNLTFDVSDDVNHEQEFGGVVSGGGSVTITAPTATYNNSLYLYGTNTYSGGTTILNKSVLALGSNAGAGTGMVTVNAPNGGLALNSGVTFTNPLTFTTGTLAGFGTFAPSGMPTITFDTGRIVAPGIGSFSHSGGSGEGASVGTLTFNADLTFANGGTYFWGLRDVTTADGMSLINISGNLLISATAGGFTLKIQTFDASNLPGFATFTVGTPYSVPILNATGTITGFNPTAFTIDATQFQGGTLTPTVFTLTQSGSTLYLNFTPVPEPSTYALLALGLGTLAAPLLRRRRRA